MTDVAVIVIDVQQEFFTGPAPAYRADEVIDGINRLTDTARTAGVPVCFVQHDGAPGEGEVEPGTPGWQIAARLAHRDGDAVVRKTVRDAFHQTNLEDWLSVVGVRRLVLCGYATPFCVDATLRRAVGLGYCVTVVDGLHTTHDVGDTRAADVIAQHHADWRALKGPAGAPAVRPLADVLATELA
ncbi:cysteine hydrolase family protein [Paraburkholderia kururiensis]|uniref:Cysteine hydrolase family protein n=1 Tax=Paraburkholderia kururiensis TaxID=984307 RepID=A0ABZ0WET9_9BURK|nr:cysteine hydrolase family protein [Paraburkholderia kururiensis]WQD75863.1 cysteine hydrolase family protein [Paraburkholderia kururiensis]